MSVNHMPPYSVIIRTTGQAHEKYQALLDSIASLSPQPLEVIVVLPKGYSLPEEQLGWETFLYSQKGMVAQRLAGITYCQTKYALICDDDVCFGPDFAKMLYQPMSEGLCGFSSGPLYSFLPPRGIRGLLPALIGSGLPTLFHKDRYTTVLRTTGYSFNRHLNPKKIYYETDSLAWTCFFANLDCFRALDYEDEIWLDRHGYCAMDDQTMFYKAHLRGIKTIVVVDASYDHLSAQTSRKQRQPVLTSLMSNRIIFWHRFIFCQEKTPLTAAWACLCIIYRYFWLFIRYFSLLLATQITVRDFSAVCYGFFDGLKYIHSEAYHKLNPVIR